MQKTAYGLRISDWSSDVCSSDLSFVGYQSKTQEIILNKDTSIIILLDIGNTLDAVQINADSPREILNSPIMGANKLQIDRKSVVSGMSVSVRLDHVCRRIFKKKNKYRICRRK